MNGNGNHKGTKDTKTHEDAMDTMTTGGGALVLSLPFFVVFVPLW